ncbi:hypothetical protein JWG42_10215 [Desulfoprunum benzoelyticum]|uniref:Uncharacterized protein n=1 Tax=Desulfoprunum benzoelyticum TaxID=1506996 RepID=A0A840V5K5_9BACT|nr:hypothetical protein [Desulfoprunum benzoelyticum]MBB5349029.1 hypothetical protein [Desulfoprunum benzoelyticum]MBM9530522.1 hypothetical protein [Desulfoprunum benzoelyticum]
MSIKHHFTSEQARQFSEDFGSDWEWSRSSEGNDPVELKVEGYRPYYPQARVEGKGPSSSAKSRPVCCSKRKNPSGNRS